jgi:hypothetical protein
MTAVSMAIRGIDLHERRGKALAPSFRASAANPVGFEAAARFDGLSLLSARPLLRATVSIR